MAYIGKSIESGTFSVLDTSGNTYNGSNTAFNLGTQVGSVAQLLVSHDGVIQKPGTDYTLSSGGTAITFSTAPASGASIFIVEISGAVGGPLDSDLNGTELILDADGDTSLHASTDDQIDIKVAGTDQITIKDGAISPVTDSDIDLGTSSLEFKDGYFDGTLHTDAINLGGTAIASTAAELNIVDGNTSATSTTIADADRVVLNDNGTMVQAAVTDLKTYIGGAVLTQVATLNDTNGSGTLTFASCFTSTYTNYFVVFDNIQVATNGADINMLFHYGDSNGNDSANHNFQSLMRYPGTTDTAGGNNENDIKFVQAQKSGTGRYVHGTMYVFQPLNTADGVTAGTIFSNSNTNNSAGAQMTVTSFNMPESGTNSAYTGFQFSASSGNIQGRITVYGITNPA